ncbi:LysR family transcriptional regulator [Rhodobacter sp. 24-YEA-8]|uniref:helix-turn-helix domain-containing protein n=1 Tax=Rhodobacter sp. 24-YEA-8 TaxID=1884310 RepID=UPI001C0DC21B
MAIELRHLRFFVSAAEHGSFRKAGTALDLSQSAISRGIADLEDQIGASLFTGTLGACHRPMPVNASYAEPVKP